MPSLGAYWVLTPHTLSCRILHTWLQTPETKPRSTAWVSYKNIQSCRYRWVKLNDNDKVCTRWWCKPCTHFTESRICLKTFRFYHSSSLLDFKLRGFWQRRLWVSAGKKGSTKQTWEGSDFKIAMLHYETLWIGILWSVCVVYFGHTISQSPAVGPHTTLTLQLRKGSGIARSILWYAIKALFMYTKKTPVFRASKCDMA